MKTSETVKAYIIIVYGNVAVWLVFYLVNTVATTPDSNWLIPPASLSIITVVVGVGHILVRALDRL
jgi:hypothetical protein